MVMLGKLDSMGIFMGKNGQKVVKIMTLMVKHDKSLGDSAIGKVCSRGLLDNDSQCWPFDHRFQTLCYAKVFHFEWGPMVKMGIPVSPRGV